MKGNFEIEAVMIPILDNVLIPFICINSSSQITLQDGEHVVLNLL